jgi:hypothetical protein
MSGGPAINTTDLVARLTQWARSGYTQELWSGTIPLSGDLTEAADEIERLRAERHLFLGVTDAARAVLKSSRLYNDLELAALEQALIAVDAS